MKHVRFKLDMKGLNELMKSEGMQKHLKKAGDEVAKSAASLAGGEVFEAEVHEADYTAISNVYPASAEAAAANYEDNVLLKAIGASGLPTQKPKL